MFSTSRRISRRHSTIVIAALVLASCGAGADGAPPDREGAPLAGNQEPLVRGPEHPRFPLPQPAGERAVGARIYEYQIEVTRDTVPAGEIEFHVINSGTTAHWLIVRNDTLFEGTPHLAPGETAVLRVSLTPGEYQLVCTIRDEFDHISEGERRFLTVL